MHRSMTVLLAGSLLLFAACGGSEEAEKPTAEDAVHVLHDAVDATLALDSMEVDSRMDMRLGAMELVLTAQGAIDYPGSVGEVMMTVDQGRGRNEVELRTDGTHTWVRLDGDGVPPVPEGKEWVRGGAELFTRTGGSLEPSGLVGVLIALRGAEEVEVGESKVIDGEPSRQYRTTVTYADAVAAAGEDEAAFTSALRMSGSEDADLVMVVWIGNDGLIRDFDLEVDAGDDPVSGSYLVEISKPNDEVPSPEAPDADDVLTGPAAEEFIVLLTSS